MDTGILSIILNLGIFGLYIFSVDNLGKIIKLGESKNRNIEKYKVYTISIVIISIILNILNFNLFMLIGDTIFKRVLISLIAFVIYIIIFLAGKRRTYKENDNIEKINNIYIIISSIITITIIALMLLGYYL